MEIKAFYGTAKKYAEKIKKEKPAYASEKDSSLCMIMGDNQEIYSGITSINIFEGNVSDVHSERAAIMSLITDSKGVKAKQMVIVAFEDMSIKTPCEECLEFLIRADADNGQCEVILAENKSETALKLKSKAAEVTEESVSEKSEDDQNDVSALGAPVEFVSGFEFDESNPFYEPPAEEQREVEALSQTMGGNSDKQANITDAQPTTDQAAHSQESAETSSEHITDEATNDRFSSDQVVSQYSDSGENVMKKRLANILGDSEEEKPKKETKAISKKELLRQSREMKKMAKQSAKYNK